MTSGALTPYNGVVVEIMKSSPGTDRRYVLEEEERRFEELTPRVRGTVRLMRFDRGIVVMAHVEAGVWCTCSRCLARFAQPVQFELAEEFYPTVDTLTGARLAPPEEGTSTISPRHILDLGEAVRQCALLNAPMKPLCLESCAGLCVTCGADLNEVGCGCPAGETDPRWAKLDRLALQLAGQD